MSDKKGNGKTSLEDQGHQDVHVEEMYEDWFLDYASYVILERAVPAIEDGLKPVQRRILHALKDIDDGRFNKVANVIGQTMQYHPHGDAAIGDAMVNIGQKELLLDTQGNWGDMRTGDPAAAARYIETRLSKFALEVAFNDKTTEWQLSYDGRKKEPVTLPMKFPLLLAQGVEGIAVGLSTKILPHNFIELIDASIKALSGKRFSLVPDFPTAGMMDASDYNDGMRGGRIKVRARIETPDKKTLLIKDIPYGTTTTSLIDSILKANDKGKLKIKRITDNTAKHVEIQIDLPSGVSPDLTIDALYAFTDCENSISPNACLISEDKPLFLPVTEILKTSADNTRDLLGRELAIKRKELSEKWHLSSLEKIFIENRIYRDIEECETWEAVIQTIDKGLDPFKKLLQREVTEEDIVRLTEIKIKRISKFDSFKADEAIKKLEEDMAEVDHHLANLTDYAIDYFQKLKDKYGKGRERKTEIRNFEQIAVRAVAANNAKLYVNRKEGFIGTGLKKDEFIRECSDLDDVIVFRADGKMQVVRIEDKKFVGKDLLHVDIWKKDDERTVYHLIYLDGEKKVNYVKRFNVTSITREKEYDLTRGKDGSKIVYFSVHPNSEEELVQILLHPASRARSKNFEFDFGSLGIKGRSAQGNIITRYPIKKVEQKELGESTLGGIEICYDETVGRLNTDERGQALGSFNTGEQILVVYKNGQCELTNFELSNRYEAPEIIEIRKFDPEDVATAIYYDGEKKNHYVKRFLFEMSSESKRYHFITENRNSRLLFFSMHPKPEVHFNVLKGKQKVKDEEKLKLTEFIDVKGWKSLGNQLSQHKLTGKIKDISPEAPKKKEKIASQKTQDKSVTIKSELEEEIDATTSEPIENKETSPSTKLKAGDTIDLDIEPTNKKSKDGGEIQGALF